MLYDTDGISKKKRYLTECDTVTFNLNLYWRLYLTLISIKIPLTGTFLVVIGERNSKLRDDPQKFYELVIPVFNINMTKHRVVTVTEANLLEPAVITNHVRLPLSNCTTVASAEHADCIYNSTC